MNQVFCLSLSLYPSACARVRTWDLSSISRMLYQLSYTRIIKVKKINFNNLSDLNYIKKIPKKQDYSSSSKSTSPQSPVCSCSIILSILPSMMSGIFENDCLIR